MVGQRGSILESPAFSECKLQQLISLNQPTEDWYTDRVTLSGAKGLDGQILRCAQNDKQDGRARRSVPMSCGSI